MASNDVSDSTAEWVDASSVPMRYLQDGVYVHPSPQERISGFLSIFEQNGDVKLEWSPTFLLDQNIVDSPFSPLFLSFFLFSDVIPFR